MVFVSYRRIDTGGEAGRLADAFRSRIGDALVFRDVADIAPGEPFDARLSRELDTATVVLVLIGTDWVAELRRRLGEPGIDYVRLEVATALAKGKRVIPVLLKGAPLPAAADLPDDLRPLAKRQAITLRDEAWDPDVDRLVDALGRPYRWRFAALRAAIALLAIVVVVKLLLPWLPEERANDVAFVRALVGGLVVVYMLIEAGAALRYLRRLQRKLKP